MTRLSELISAMAQTAGGGSIVVCQNTPYQGYNDTQSRTPGQLWRLMRGQWRVAGIPGALREVDVSAAQHRREGLGPGGLAEEDFGFGVALGRDQLELAGGLDQRHPDDVGAAQRHHHAERLVVYRLDRMHAEPGGEHPVERR